MTYMLQISSILLTEIVYTIFICMIARVCKIVFKQTTAKPCPGFLALKDTKIRQQVLKAANPKLDALAQVVLSLQARQMQYVNLLLAQKTINSGQSILKNKVLSLQGQDLLPVQYFYQKAWMKQEWKETNLLHYIISNDKQQAGGQQQVQVVKQNYDVELTSLDPAQKIKAIKSIRQILNLGLKEAKEFADKAPSILKKDLKKDQAEKLKEQLEKVGCVVTLK